jgi:cation diffusion facilitator family transporter
LDAARKNIQVQKWVAGLSIVLLVAKLAAFYITHSVSILSDALEGIVNIVAGFIGLYSLYVAAKPRDLDHPYGHGKIEFISAAVEGAMIFVAGFVIIYQAVRNILYPLPLEKLDVGIYIVGVTAAVNYIMGTICIRIARKNNSIALDASGKHLQSDTYTTIGIIIGLGIVYITKILWLDSVIAIVFAAIIVITGYKILRTSLAGIMDEYDRALLIKMVSVLNHNKRENWVDLHNVRIIKYGNVLHLDAHLTVPWYLNVNEAHQEIDELTKLIRNRFGNSMEFFIHTDGCLDFQCRLCTKSDCPVRKHTFEKTLPWTVENISNDKKHHLEL